MLERLEGARIFNNSNLPRFYAIYLLRREVREIRIIVKIVPLQVVLM